MLRAEIEMEDVTAKLIEMYEKDGWENVLVSEIEPTDYGKVIQVYTKTQLFTMGIKNQFPTRPLHIPNHLISTREKSMITVHMYDNMQNKRSKRVYVNDDEDLCFIRDSMFEPENPLKSWCKQFLKDLQNNNEEKRNKAEELSRHFGHM